MIRFHDNNSVPKFSFKTDGFKICDANIKKKKMAFS